MDGNLTVKSPTQNKAVFEHTRNSPTTGTQKLKHRVLVPSKEVVLYLANGDN